MIVLLVLLLFIIGVWLASGHPALNLKLWAILLVVSFSSITFAALYAWQQRRFGIGADYGPVWTALGIAAIALVVGLALAVRSHDNDQRALADEDHTVA